MNLILALFLIVGEATFEGLKIRGRHILSASFEFLYLSVITFICFAWVADLPNIWDAIYIPMWKILLGYVFVRFALFDLVYNFVAKQKLNFIGSTKLFDKLLSKIRDMWGMSTIWFVRGILGVIGLVWLLNIGQ
jgi:hypothetical protein